MGSVYHSLLKHLWALSVHWTIMNKAIMSTFCTGVCLCVCVSMFLFLFLRYIFKSAIAGLCTLHI